MKSLTAFVIGCIAIIILYIIIAIILQAVMNVELSTALTAGVFGFFGTELAATAFIRISKNNSEKESEEE